ncbi:conserved hypothetical protein [Sporisorium reilianum SRZ2]|uniref:Uncharacterized protein n=1 Tax=Sporisorium reilianum (strain SRZ2) TaxID=999809 RepID=E6ZV54_SPORE|nr:conserved hypothetical protein [Sporisorium reilianum SRZ2]
MAKTTQTAPAVPAAELPTLTLDHILSDLGSLSRSHALFTLGPPSVQPSGSRNPTETLQRFEAGSAPSDRKAYVELSHALLASYATAQRLNSERVSAAQVGLALPFERTSANVQSGGGREVGKQTRTDLLHAKVAGLQESVDAWHRALETAVQSVEGSSTAQDSAAIETTDHNVDAPASVGSGTAREHIETIPDRAPASTPTRPSEPSKELHAPPNPAAPAARAATASAEDAFEDDDPWNDLT